jgi:monoamine oxidase
MQMPHLSRRSLLGGLALGGTTYTAGGLADAVATPALGRSGSLPGRVDVVVVGAGLSGLVAAERLAQHGRDVLVVEARDRVGGRVLNHHLGHGHTIESGGAFIGPTQTRIAALARRLGVRTFEEYVDGQSVYVSSTLGRMTYQGTVPPDPTILADAGLLQTRIDEYAQEIDVAAPWTHPRAVEWDRITLAQYIRANCVNADGINRVIRCWTQPGFGADPEELSFLYVVWYCACSGDRMHPGTFERNSDTADGAQQQRFVGGSQLVPLRLANRLGDVVALDAPAHRIEQHHDHAVVHTGRGPVRARRVVVAVPPPMALGIDWHPHLPAGRRALLRHLDMGELMKCDAVYRTPFWRSQGLNGFGIADSGAVRAAFDNSPRDGDPGVLLAFVGGGTWREYGLVTRAGRRRAVLQGFATMFGDQALHPVDYVEHDWTQERWTAGGPVANYGPEVMTSVGHTIRTPFRRVHWAGTETSTYWTGYMDGAVRAGERVAREVLGR